MSIALRRLLASTLFAGVILVLPGCGGDPTTATVSVVLQNKAADAAYMWIGHAEEPAASDLVAPGGMRGVSLSLKARMDSSNEIDVLNDTIKLNVRPVSKSTYKQTFSMDQKYAETTTAYVAWDGKAASMTY